MTKIKFGFGPFNFSYDGSNLLPDLLKAGAVCVGVYGVCSYIKEGNEFSFWRKKEKIRHKSLKKKKDEEDPNPTPEKDIMELEEEEFQIPPGITSDELFGRKPSGPTKWLVHGYMKPGLVNLLVGGSSVAKSVFMCQSALAVIRGSRPEFLPEDCSESLKQPVIYYRLEDFEDELQGKYGDGKIFRETDIHWFLPKDLPYYTLAGFLTHLKALAKQIEEDTVVFIDPATKLDGYKHKTFIKGVEEAMRIAKKRGHNLTPVASIHLDEIKDWLVLSNCDITGGDKAIQQAGSVTALRKERTGEEYRYLQCLKEPKGSPKPFNGEVLVMKMVDAQLDESNHYLHYEYCTTKPEPQARPLKPKAVVPPDDSPTPVKSASTTGQVVNLVKPVAPNQKITPEIEEKMKEMFEQGIKPSVIARKLLLAEKTIRRKKKQLGF